MRMMPSDCRSLDPNSMKNGSRAWRERPETWFCPFWTVTICQTFYGAFVVEMGCGVGDDEMGNLVRLVWNKQLGAVVVVCCKNITGVMLTFFCWVFDWLKKFMRGKRALQICLGTIGPMDGLVLGGRWWMVLVLNQFFQHDEGGGVDNVGWPIRPLVNCVVVGRCIDEMCGYNVRFLQFKRREWMTSDSKLVAHGISRVHPTFQMQTCLMVNIFIKWTRTKQCLLSMVHLIVLHDTICIA